MSELELIKQDIKTVTDISCLRFIDNRLHDTKLTIPAEISLTLYVNNIELVTIMCTPEKLNALILGFLFSEGIIASQADISLMRVCIDESMADVRLIRNDFQPPVKRVLTSGCGGGTVFDVDKFKYLNTTRSYSPEQIYTSMKKMQDSAVLFKLGKGVHTSALSNGEDIAAIAEDIGRHNTIDKLIGECMLRGLNPSDYILLTTGRISAEMISKTNRVGISIIVSRSTGTNRAVELAEKSGVTLIAYARGKRFDIYTHPDRIIKQD